MPVTARAVRPTAAVDLRPHPKIGEGAGPSVAVLNCTSIHPATIPRPGKTASCHRPAKST